MLYRLVMNYIRLQLLRKILSRVFVSKGVKGHNLKSMSLATYIIELASTFLFKTKKKINNKS